MEPMEIAMIVSVVSDALIRVIARVQGEDPEKLKEEIAALQVKADDLEKWLRAE